MTKRSVRLKINSERCKECLLCIDVCPQNILGLSDEINKRGCRHAILEDPEKCTGCGMCAIMCPDCCIDIEIDAKDKKGK